MMEIWAFWLLLFISIFADSFSDFDLYSTHNYQKEKDLFDTHDNPSIKYTYTRISEIEKQCGSILSSASELEPDDNRGSRIKKELFFVNGDWEQEHGGAPLMPFNDVTKENDYFRYGTPHKLVSFWVTDINPIHQVKDAVSISAVMEIGITSSISFSVKPYDWSPRFYKGEGISQLTILFEGVYTESDENGGEQSMCLLGNATMPALSQDADSWESDNQYGYNYNQRSSLVQDDQILLVLRYPKTFSLTRRGILGEMKSLNQRWNLTYFNQVHISSLGRNSKYEFGSEEIVAKACSPSLYQDELVNQEVVFKGDAYCEKLCNLVQNEAFNFVPNWKHVGSKDYYRKIGTFLLGWQIAEIDSFFEEYRLQIQEVFCEPTGDENEIQSMSVSAIFRVVKASEYQYREEERTGLFGATLSAEGTFRSSHGQLCMVGCLGLVGAPSKTCNTRISLYLPLIFSITQRSMVFGTISSINETSEPLSLVFEKDSSTRSFRNKYSSNRNLDWSYNYTKIIQASEFQKRSKPSKLGILLRKSFLGYPSLKGNQIANISFLSDVLSVRVGAIPQTLTNAKTSKIYAEINVLSLGLLFGRYWSRPNQENQIQEQAYSRTDAIRISGHLSITGKDFFNISLFLEGLYDPVVGEMYLVGCRDVRAFPKYSYNGTNIDGGMDCEVEVKVKYPPNAPWLLNPNIKISVSSKRSKKDPLYLSPTTFNTFLLSHQKIFDDLLFQKAFEEMLRVLMLTVAVLCTLSQMRYTKNAENFPAYTSLVMLSVHTLSYSIPLIISNEVQLFNVLQSSQTNEFESFQHLQVLDSLIKILMLVALLLTLKLSQKICGLRTKQLHNFRATQTPNERLVILVTLAIHALGFFVFRVCQEYVSQTSGCLLQDLEDYGAIVQDFFLLPQIVGAVVWHIQGNCKPLRKLYYWGFTTIRLLLHVYYYLRDPPPNPRQVDDDFEYSGFDVYAKLGNVTVAAILVVLAVIVSIQQRCKNKHFVQARKLEECEDPSLEADIYQKLLSD